MKLIAFVGSALDDRAVDELPGYLGWFTIPGMPNTALYATDPGSNSMDGGGTNL
jgi:hypothetical protein